MKLDLETLKQVKFTFDIHSDHSTRCNGYRSLCRMIEEAEKEVNENFVQPDVNGRSKLLLDFMQHLSWYYNIDEVIDCTKHKHIIEQYIKSNNCE